MYSSPTIKTYNEYFLDNQIIDEDGAQLKFLVDTTITGTGTESDPYIINSSEDFWWASKYLTWSGKYVALACDIVLNEEKFDENGNAYGGDGIVYSWKSVNNYLGFIDGKYKKISGLYYNDGEEECRGLFDNKVNEIKNLTLSNIFMNVVRYTGAGAFGNRVGVLTNCETESGMLIFQQLAGGLVYLADNIYGCVNRANLVSLTSHIGGLVYELVLQDSMISNCVNYGNIKALSDTYVGGIVCILDNRNQKVIDCENYGELSAGCLNGGIVGYIRFAGGYDNNILIENCKNHGDLSHNGVFEGDRAKGGIVGGIRQSFTRIRNCVNYGNLLDLHDSYHSAGLVGYVEHSSIEIYKSKNYGKAYRPIIGYVSYDKNYNSKAQYFIVNECEGYFEEALFGIGYGTETTISNCKFYFKNKQKNTAFLQNSIKDMFGGKYRINNVYVEGEIVTDVQSYLFDFYSKADYDIKNFYIKMKMPRIREIIIYNSRDTNVMDGTIVELYDNKSTQRMYYGSGFSGFNISWKTGAISLNSMSSVGSFAPRLTEENLIGMGFQKKVI